MNEATIGSLFIEIIKTGALGLLFGTTAKAIGRKEFAALIIIVTLILCAIMTYQMISLMVESAVNFFEPITNFFDAFSRKKEAIDNTVEPLQDFIEKRLEGGKSDG